MTELQTVLCVICLRPHHNGQNQVRKDFLIYFMPIGCLFPYVTGVKLKYCSQGIPTTGFYLNHAFML